MSGWCVEVLQVIVEAFLGVLVPLCNSVAFSYPRIVHFYAKAAKQLGILSHYSQVSLPPTTAERLIKTKTEATCQYSTLSSNYCNPHLSKPWYLHSPPLVCTVAPVVPHVDHPPPPIGVPTPKFHHQRTMAGSKITSGNSNITFPPPQPHSRQPLICSY